MGASYGDMADDPTGTTYILLYFCDWLMTL